MERESNESDKGCKGVVSGESADAAGEAVRATLHALA